MVSNDSTLVIAPFNYLSGDFYVKVGSILRPNILENPFIAFFLGLNVYCFGAVFAWKLLLFWKVQAVFVDLALLF